MAKQRPYVWRNHRDAIAAGYLETGVSAAVSFPTGGGKSKLAELKIAASLLRGVKVIFLVPTLALVEQTANALGKTFPQAQVQRERAEEVVFSPMGAEPLPGISVLTPERCLAMLSFTPAEFEDVGLIVFDECHLLQAIRLTEEEQALYRSAVEEIGDAEYLYVKVTPEGSLLDASACHHGLLIIQERQLHEELFRRQDGVNVLVATSTLAQGMNLPSEVVIIAGDSRFDPEANRLEQLDAHELLNAAGRAGRAGEASQGFVLIVPSKVVDFQSKTNQIHSHWSDLQAIFSQSDQCLEIDDPFTALLDQVHTASEPISSAAKYLLGRLPRGPELSPDEPATALLSRSLCAFRARQRSDAQWITTRTEAAIRVRNADPDITNTWIDQIAATSGIPTRILTGLTQSLFHSASALPSSTIEWRTWLFNWLRTTPSAIPQLMRPESLEGMFGATYRLLQNDDARGTYALGLIEKMLPAWMSGCPLVEIERLAGTPESKLGKCEVAREFTLRCIPELSYLYGVLAQLYLTLFSTEPVPIALATLGAAVREGLDQPEKVALRQIRSRRPNRIAIHREFQEIAKLIPSPTINEDLSGVVLRVQSAIDVKNWLHNCLQQIVPSAPYASRRWLRVR
ncbi:DEAD/DEAH box helicase [Bradyrhizobium japonicum]|uniref:DEAD/DEAH box helicase n=1 Tax=Bradyrhizobium japonicum TaxID=375 RepID=UPI001B8A4AFB|nr:DEAD/DEAH box helicase [Bradyrhizobium japonicum]MBR0974550.1 DEAD/DEAH box helicase [Bradyrhizobium japonicum]